MLVSKFTWKLARYLNISGGASVATLGREDQEHVLDAINAGLQQFYADAPEILKRAPMVGIMLGPQQQTITVTQGSSTFSGFTATTGQLFSSIVIAGEQRNRIVGPNELLFPWESESGTKDAIIYGDAVTFGPEAVIERIVTDPIITGPNILNQPLAPASFNGAAIGQRVLRKWDNLPEVEIGVGIPTFYREENYGQALPGRPFYALRVWPMPDQAYRFQVQADVTAFQVREQQLVDDVTWLPIEDRHIDNLLLPLCLFHMMDHRLWKTPENRELVMQKFAAAEDHLRSMPKYRSEQSNFVGTPRGF